MEKIERVNYDTFKHIFEFINGKYNNSFIEKEYNNWLLEIEPTRVIAVMWWNNLPPNMSKRILMESYWSKIRPYIQQPDFVSIDTDKISGREIEIIYNEEN